MPRHRAASTRVAAVAGAGMLAIATLASCGGGDGADQPAERTQRTRTDVTDATKDPPTPTPTRSPGSGAHSPTRTTPIQGGDESPSHPPEGVPLGESLQVGALEVRALDYTEAGFDGAATGTRVDVVTVQECATGGSARVQHRTWRLLDADGRTLGVAGGKMVNGNPTEDLPETLGVGQCVTTELVIGVPAGSAPTAVQDGPDAIWILAD